MIVKFINISWNLIKLCVIVIIECDLIDVHLIIEFMSESTRASLKPIFN